MSLSSNMPAMLTLRSEGNISSSPKPATTRPVHGLGKEGSRSRAARASSASPDRNRWDSLHPCQTSGVSGRSVATYRLVSVASSRPLAHVDSGSARALVIALAMWLPNSALRSDALGLSATAASTERRKFWIIPRT